MQESTLHVAENKNLRLGILFGGMVLVGCIIIARLFFLMVINHDYYKQQADGSHGLFVELFPKRGSVFAQSTKTKEEFPLAMNRDHFTVFADTRRIKTDDAAETAAEKLSAIFGYDDEQKYALFLQLNKRTDPYEPLVHKVDEETVDKIKRAEVEGIHFNRTPLRVYPEGPVAAQVVGFVGKDEGGNDKGSYGVEGYWQQVLAGEEGFLEGERSAGGKRIPLVGTLKKAQEDGADILLTIDRTLQYHTCEILRRYMTHFEATGASLVILDPHTGAVRVMCSLPDFDPNTYNKVESIEVYNNKAIFTPYEPGSIFKPVAIAAALNEGLITPDSYFYDTGSVDANCLKEIKNADGQIYKDTTMTGVLENSINTGMVHAVELLGKKVFREYVEQFGFGVKAGVALNTEVSGQVDSLYRNDRDELDCYTATASFGQGITATPLQMASAFGAIANGGTLLKPYVVEEVRYPSGKIERYKAQEVRRVISRQSAALLSGMLASVIDNGQAKAAQVEGYYVAGKTGTAQIAEKGVYIDDTNHSFIGFGPVENPAFVIMVKLERPQNARFSSGSAAPAFGEIAKFVMDYLEIPPTR
ncbi:MAG: penicillin-binding protein 2 [Candidatus Magasanikbacteria bacterium]|jgi:cell division protein FtsI/penicillin-binding protein 2|nr:penicillin-binding protein 2 [Candidatus Magasanikbacteria bacterium]